MPHWGKLDSGEDTGAVKCGHEEAQSAQSHELGSHAVYSMFSTAFVALHAPLQNASLAEADAGCNHTITKSQSRGFIQSQGHKVTESQSHSHRITKSHNHTIPQSHNQTITL